MDRNPRGKIVQDSWDTLKNEIIKIQTKTISQRKTPKRFQMKPVWLYKELSEKLRDKMDKYKKI